jgi:hypothetical protein
MIFRIPIVKMKNSSKEKEHDDDRKRNANEVMNDEVISTPKKLKQTDNVHDSDVVFEKENSSSTTKQLLDIQKSPLGTLLLSSQLSDVDRDKLFNKFSSPSPGAASLSQQLLPNDTLEKETDQQVLLDVSKKKLRSKKMNFYIKESKGSREKGVSPNVVKRNTAFCCALCNCRKDYRKQFMDRETRGYLRASSTSLYHRRCCHRAFTWTKKWKSPYEKAVCRSMPTEDNLHLLDEIKSEVMDVTIEEIKSKYTQAKKEESEMYNMDGVVGTDYNFFFMKIGKYFHILF